MTQPDDIRLRRLDLRSWRRGMREMDLILGRYADASLPALSDEALDAYEALLEENDQDLYRWVSGSEPTPVAHETVVADIADFHGIARKTWRKPELN